MHVITEIKGNNLAYHITRKEAWLLTSLIELRNNAVIMKITNKIILLFLFMSFQKLLILFSSYLKKLLPLLELECRFPGGSENLCPSSIETIVQQPENVHVQNVDVQKQCSTD